MKLLTSSISATIAASFFALAASANATDLLDARLDSTADQAQVSWSGIYFGAQIGYGITQTELHAVEEDDDSATIDSLAGDGFFGGLHVGKDIQLGKVVAGVRGSYDWSNSKTTITQDGGQTLFDGSIGDQGSITNDFTASLENKQSWSALGRLGFLVTPEALVYGLAGYTETKFTAGGTFARGTQNEFTTSGSQTVPGYTVGGGIELAKENGWFIALDVTHTFYDEVTLHSDDEITLTADPDETKAMLKLSKKFTFAGF